MLTLLDDLENKLECVCNQVWVYMLKQINSDIHILHMHNTNNNNNMLLSKFEQHPIYPVSQYVFAVSKMM